MTLSYTLSNAFVVAIVAHILHSRLSIVLEKKIVCTSILDCGLCPEPTLSANAESRVFQKKRQKSRVLREIVMDQTLQLMFTENTIFLHTIVFVANP